MSLLARWLHPLRLLAGRFIIPSQANYTGRHGCLRTGASFAAWNQVEGDYLEFGVFEGSSFAAAFEAFESERRQAIAQAGATQDADFQRWRSAPPRYFAFDSFEGLPEGDAARQVDYAPGAYAATEAHFRSRIAAAGVDLNRVVTVKGFYDQTLTPELKIRHQLRRAALVMIDCDLYESTVPVLDFLTSLVGQGTILVFHDWFRFKGDPRQGEQRACREWLERNPQFELIEYWREGPQAMAFLVNMR